MIPERLEFLGRVDKFYRMLIEQTKQDIISEDDFYLLLAVKAKSMNRERIRNRVNNNKIQKGSKEN